MAQKHLAQHRLNGREAWLGLLVLASIVLVPVPQLFGQQAVGVIYGRMTDGRGHPQHFLVKLVADGELPAGSVYADSEGQYAFQELPSGQYWVVVEAPGFQPLRQFVRLDEHVNAKVQANLVLEPLATAPEAPSPVVSGSAASHTVDVRNFAPDFDARALREFNKANALEKSGDLKGAVAHYQRAANLDPRLYPALNNLGALYERQGQHRQAEDTLLKALAVNSSDGESYLNLGHVLYEEGRYAEARARLEEGLKRSPQSATGRFFLGSTELKLGDLGPAETDLKLACTLDSHGMPAAHLQLANVYLRARALPAAAEQLETYLQANPADPQAPAIRKLLASVQQGQKN